MTRAEDGACTGKTAYTSPGQAHYQLTLRTRTRKRKHTKQSGRGRADDPHIYKCKNCKLWHIGRFHV